MRPVVRAAALTVVSSLLLAAAGTADAAPAASTSPATTLSATTRGLPAGWSVAGGTLSWVSPKALPLTGAGVQFYSGEQLLGFPARSADGRTYRLAAAPGSYRAAALGVFAAGRRLDGSGVTASARKKATPSPITAAPKLTRSKVDPGAPGRYATRSGDYTLPAVKLPGLPANVEMQGHVVAPIGAPGARPLVLLLHGRHSVCYQPGTKPTLGDQVWPCPAGEKPIPSQLGYLKAQKLLASQGYLTVSIAANGINGQDGEQPDGGAQARSSLVRLHLGHWADWSAAGRSSAPTLIQQVPPANLQKVLLVGHSRGGEGVNRAALDSLDPPPSAVEGYPGAVRWRIGGTVLIGPTIFGHDPAADVPSVTLLPGCDGDVSDLQGQMYVDASRATASGTALHSAVHVVGANHNYFNAQWTPKLAAAPADDDWFTPSDKLCGTNQRAAKTSRRLKPALQQQVGAVYTAAAARLFLAGDDRVRPVLDGSPVRPASLAGVQVATSVIGLRRTPLVLPAATTSVKGSGTSSVAVCKQVAAYGAAGGCLSSDGESRSPNFTPFVYGASDPDRQAVRLRWTKAGSRVSIKAGAVTDLSSSSSVALRLIVPPNSTSTRLDVAVVDAAGKRATLGRLRPVGLPATGSTVAYWAQELRVPLAAAARTVDLTRITRLELVPRSTSGRAWLIDAWGRRAGTPEVRRLARTRIDVGDLGEQAEGDGTRTVQVPLTAAGAVAGTVRVFVEDSSTGKTTSSVVAVPAGGTVAVPVTIKGDRAFGYESEISVYARALPGTVVGAYTGGVKVVDDDPEPSLSVAVVDDDVAEGGTLRWRLTASGPAEVELTAPVSFLKPTSGRELSTTDVRASWVRDKLFVKPLPSRVMSKSDGFLSVFMPAGKTTADLTVPTVKDTLKESAEKIRLQVSWEPSPTPLPAVTGTVRNA